MRKKILITVGCSLTEGVGCYDYSHLPVDVDISTLSPMENRKLYENNLDNFLKGSWGTQLQKKIGYHTHINCGIGSSSNSHQLKNFMDTMHLWDIDESDVLVIWLMTFNHRFSFYNGDSPTTYGVFNSENDSLDDSTEKLSKATLVELSKNDYDISMMLESLFYLRCMRDICRVNNFKFLHSTTEDSIEYQGLLNKYLDKTSLENRLRYTRYGGTGYSMMENAWRNISHCGHPNEIGYSAVADNIFKAISENSPNLINDTKPHDYIQIRNPLKYHILDENKRLN
jgi:hypothetical protein